MTSRRDFVKKFLMLGTLINFPRAIATQDANVLIRKTIPSSGERLAPIGMGTWITFDVVNKQEALLIRNEILNEFFTRGGQLVDSSPMYGSSEEVVGYCLNRLGKKAEGLFSATKVWTADANLGKQQIDDSHRLWNLPVFDLFQVHNLVNWRQHLKTLNHLKQEGIIRYLGVTTSHGLRHEELTNIMRTTPLDFIQLTYNLLDREAEKNIFPLALEKGIAVIANRPLHGGQLFDRFSHLKLPDWAQELDCKNWAQVFLKFVVSHPAITCAIPATSKVAHMKENMGAQVGRLPGSDMRERIAQLI